MGLVRKFGIIDAISPRVANWPFMKLFATNKMLWSFGLFWKLKKIVLFKACFLDLPTLTSPAFNSKAFANIDRYLLEVSKFSGSNNLHTAYIDSSKISYWISRYTHTPDIRTATRESCWFFRSNRQGSVRKSSLEIWPGYRRKRLLRRNAEHHGSHL